VISSTNLYDDYDPDEFDETGAELVNRLPGYSPRDLIDGDDPLTW
jgi:hypothetical protein